MDPRPVSPDLPVSPQTTPADPAAAAAEGDRAVICTRPDGEGADQPAVEEIGSAARAAGMAARRGRIPGPTDPRVSP